MNCPNCGAPMRPVQGRDHFVCDFCTTFHFPEESPDGVVVIGEPGARSCPVCGVELVSAYIRKRPVEHCTRCHGVLVQRSSFNQIVQSLRARNRRPREQPEPLNPEESQRDLRCPNCDRAMEAHPYHGPGHVLVDSCYPCHLIWLDRGEIATIGRS